MIRRGRFYMKAWAFSEVLQAYVTPPLEAHNTHGFCSRPFMGPSRGSLYEESELWYLYDTYGASPEVLCRYAREPSTYEEDVIRQVQLIELKDLLFAFRSPDS